MNILQFHGANLNERYIDTAVNALRRGEIIIYPTDTLYAIGCDALNQRSVEAICRLKGINPAKQHLSILCASLSQASEYARIDNYAFRVLKENLPGPFTFILPAATTLPKVFKGRKEVGVRIPDSPVPLALAEALGHPLLTASIDFDLAEPDEAVNPESIAMRYESVASFLLDGGSGTLTPSAVVDLTDSRDPRTLRPGPRPLK